MRQLPHKIYQTGVVLFIALVALVVMSLAAAALIRSVDTNTVISGNLALQQSAVIAADRGAEAALTWLEGMAAAGNLNTLNNNIIAQGYHATVPDLRDPPGGFAEINLDDQTVLRNNATWNNANSVEIPANTSDGNTLRYIVQRMCLRNDNPGDTPPHCLFGSKPAPPNAENIGYQAPANTAQDGSPMYRVTVRVTGPKNKTVTYVQAYAY